MIPTDPAGTPIRNDPGAVVIRVYRVQDDGLSFVDIGGALVNPKLVARVAEIQASLAGVLGAEIVKAIMLEVYGHTGAPTPTDQTETAPLPPAPRDFFGDFLQELDDDGRRENREPK